MILAAMSHIAFQLNQSLKRAYGLTEDIAVVSKLLELDGTATPQANNKLALFLVNVEKDSVPRPISASNQSNAARQPIQTAPLYLNLYVLLVANFSNGNYPESLKFLSSAISFFQQHPIFDHRTSPDLHTGIEKLILDIENLGIQELSNLWGILGGKYAPSILYKVRMVTLGGNDLIGQAYPVKAPEAALQT